MSYLILDIETVPDASLWTAAPPKPRARTKTDDFAPLYAHRPIAIGSVLLSDQHMVEYIGVAGTTLFGDDEAALLTAWSAWMQQARPVLVSYNGRGFDISVIELRALRHGVNLGWHDKDYRNRYGESHIDLFDQVTKFGIIARNGFSLGTMSTLIGLPPKGGMDGSKVAGMFAAGEAAKIEAYCASDCARTAFLFMRYQLMRGRMTVNEYREAAGALLRLCTEREMHGVLFGADQKRLLLEG